MPGVVIHLQQKSGAQCGAYGWWLPSQKHINIKQQHVGWLAANLKAVQKLPPFDETTAVNVQLFSRGQQADFGSVWHHHTAQYRWNHVLEGSAHSTSGDARCGDEDQDWFLEKSDNPDSGGMNSFLPKKSGHRQTGGATNHDGSREVLTLCSGQFVVPEAHDIDWVLGAPNFVQSVRSTELFKKVPGGLWCWSATCLDRWILQGHIVLIFSISLHHSPTPDRSQGIVIFNFNFSNCSLLFW